MRTRAPRARSRACSGGTPVQWRTSASTHETLARGPGGCLSSCGHLKRYPWPRRLCGVLCVAERKPQLLGHVRRQRPEQLAEQRERLDQRLAVCLAELAPARDHALLVVLDSLEQPHHVADRAVH